jgi:hypothetical protein
MSAQSATYSFKDTAGSLTNPVLLGSPITFAGEIGMGQFTVEMHTVRTYHDVAADGTVMVSYAAGDNGAVTIDVQQTSGLHAALLGLYNLLKQQADQGNATNWAASAMSLLNTVDLSQHILKGVSIEKIPNKVYAAQGQRLQWRLMAASISNITLL